MLSFSSISETPIGSAVTTLDANAFLEGVDATSSAGILGYEGKAKTTMPFALGTTAAGTLNYDAEANTILSSVIASIATDTLDYDAEANATLSGVSSTGSVNSFSDVYGKANVTPSAATATFTADSFDYDAKANTTLSGVSMSVSYGAFADEDAQASTTITGVSASGAANWDTVNGVYAVQVVFTATDFERKRCVNIVPYGNYKVYVTR